MVFSASTAISSLSILRYSYHIHLTKNTPETSPKKERPA